MTATVVTGRCWFCGTTVSLRLGDDGQVVCFVCQRAGRRSEGSSEQRAAARTATRPKARTRKPRTLTEHLEELERTDPAVAEAKRSYDRTVRRILRKPPSEPVRKEHAACCIARRDAHGRLPIGFCSPACIRRPG